MLNGLYDFFSALGFGDPLHPPITHMPIGLATGAFVFILIAVIFKKKNLEITVRHVSILAFVFAFPTILLGALDWIHYYRAVLFTPIVIKMTLSAVLLVELAIGIFLGNKLKMRSFVTAFLSGVGFAAVIGLGWFGSGIMYSRGVDLSAAVPAVEPAVSASPSSAPAPDTKPAAGESVFTGFCASCHPGGGNVIRPDLPVKTSRRLVSREGFIAFIRDPKLPDGRPGAMPAFPADTLPDEAAGQLYDYLRYMSAREWK